MRQLVDEDESVWQLPFGELCGEKFTQLIGRGCHSSAQNHYSDRAFVPLGVRHGNHPSLTDRGMRGESIFQVDRADPFATRLDQIFGSISDLHVTFMVDGG